MKRSIFAKKSVIILNQLKHQSFVHKWLAKKNVEIGIETHEKINQHKVNHRAA